MDAKTPVALIKNAPIKRTVERQEIRIEEFHRALALAEEPQEILGIEAKLDAIESYMTDSGLYAKEEILVVNQTRMLARWKLGRALAKIDRKQGNRTLLSGFTKFLKSLNPPVTRVTANQAQRIGALPEKELNRILAKALEEIRFLYFRELVALAKPFWLANRRDAKHESIAKKAKGNKSIGEISKCAVVYADPPWRYEHPPMGSTSRSIEQQYPTMTIDEICSDKHVPISRLVTDDAVLFMWATAPKMAECMEVIEAWGFTYRTNMVWVKDKIGTGYHVRNQHEILLIAKRGDIPPPSPKNRPSSVVHAKRGKHSEKPDMFYSIIEKMYPKLPKIELFARKKRKGWESWGLEAGDDSA